MINLKDRLKEYCSYKLCEDCDVRGMCYDINYVVERANYVDELIDEIECTDWYHIRDGKLVHGASSKEEGTEPLYKAEDILKILDKYRSEDD